MQHRIFVYGTLKTGHRANSILQEAILVGQAVTRPEFTMYSVGGSYPAVVNTGNTKIVGEVYEIDSALLQSLDVYEGYPDLYTRTEVSVTLTDQGKEVDATLYLFNNSVENYEEIPSGIWEK